MGLTAIAALQRGPRTSLGRVLQGFHQPELFSSPLPATISLGVHLRDGDQNGPVVFLRIETTLSGPGRCSGRRAGNEIQVQLECSGDNSCFWDSVARCPAIGGGLLLPGHSPGGQTGTRPSLPSVLTRKE